jgi:uncharacterized protein YpmB
MENVAKQEQRIRMLNENLERLRFKNIVLIILLAIISIILVGTLLATRRIGKPKGKVRKTGETKICSKCGVINNARYKFYFKCGAKRALTGK